MNIFTFTLFKYFNFILLFLRGLLIASILDVYSYSLWGVVMFATSYYSILGLGIPNIILIIFKDIDDPKHRSNITGTAIIYSLCLLFLFSIIFTIFSKFSYLKYSDVINYNLLIVYAFLLIVIEILRNVSRYENLYKIILLAEFFATIPLIFYLVIKPFILNINNMVLVLIFSLICSIILYLKYVSLSTNRTVIYDFFKLIFKLGLPLLVFNFSTYILFLLFRESIIFNYDEITISNFNFAWFISNSIILVLNTFSWYLYPNILKGLSNKTDKLVYKDYLYIQFLITLVILLVSYETFEFIVINYYERYSGSIVHFKYLIVNHFIFFLTFYPSTHLVAHDNKIPLLISGFISVFVFLIFNRYVLTYTKSLNIELEYITLSVSSIIFLFVLNYLSRIRYSIIFTIPVVSIFCIIMLLDNFLLNTILFFITLAYIVINLSRIKIILVNMTNENSNI